MASGTVAVKFTGDVANLKRSLTDVDRSLGGVDGKVQRFSGRAKVAFAAAGVAVVAFGKSSIDAYKDAEVAQAALTEAYEKFPQLAGENADALRDLNSELAKTTKFDDDATASAQALLAQFGLTHDQLIELTPLVQDYAEKTGKDLTTAATDLGKAMLGQGRALKTVGIDFEDTGTAAGNFDQIVAGLTTQVGGFAEVAGGTAAGKTEILKNQFGELQEKVGSVLVPVLTKLVDYIVDEVLPAIDKMTTWLGDNEGAAQALAVVVGTVLVGAMVAYTASAVSAAAATIAATWPVLLAVIAVAALAAGLYYAYNNWEWFRQGVAGAILMLVTIKGFIESVIGAVKTLARTVSDALGPLKSLISLGNQIGGGGVGAAAAGFSGSQGIKGKRARGGPVSAGSPYLVGEEGPEVFMPGASGSIVPNRALGGGVTVVNVNVSGTFLGTNQTQLKRELVALLGKAGLQGIRA